MVGGKLLNNPRMAQLHAQEAPDRVRELERWGAVFDRTRDGRILQRPFGGHTHPRLAHVGDRTGPRDDPDPPGPRGRGRASRSTWSARSPGSSPAPAASPARSATGGRPAARSPSRRKAVVLATGGIGKAYEITSNSWEYSGDGQALAYEAGAELIDMEFVQFHPTGMVWPPGVRGLLVTEAVRGEGGILRNANGERFMWKYLPEDRRAEYAATDEEARALGRRPVGGPRDRRPAAARAVDPRQRRAGDLHRGQARAAARRTAASSSTSATCRADHVRRKLPSMYEQFKELADVDITKGPMEVGPTTHYVMGGIRVDADTGATTVPGLYAAGEVAGGHARREPARRQLAVRPARVRARGPERVPPPTRRASRAGRT